MSQFRIRPIMNYVDRPSFALEEKTTGFFGNEKWKQHDRACGYWVSGDTPYETWVGDAIEEMRKKHRAILKARGVAYQHLKHPIIYLDDTV